MYMKSNIITFEELKKNILDHVTQLRDLLTQGHANDNVTFPILSCICPTRLKCIWNLTLLRLRNSKKNILDHVTQLRDLLTQGHANDNATFPILSCICPTS